MSRTVAAIATPPGNSGVGIVRISGPRSLEIGSKMFTSLDGIQLVPRHATLGIVKGKDFSDTAIAIFFQSPNTFTGDDIIEIQAHGGFFLLCKILETAIEHGAVLADNGEFSRTAFLNGKMSLNQAEAIIEIINAESDLQLKYAQTTFQGHLNKLLVNMEKELVAVSAQIEATLDYPEHDIEHTTEIQISPQIERIDAQIKELKSTATAGKMVAHGVRVAVLGKPNVGKSTLFNALLGSDRSIVTDIAGTTTDVITESIHYKGVKIVFADTAGIRKADGQIEKLGIKRTRAALEECDIALAVFDSSEAPDDYDEQIIELCKDRMCINVLNKSDKKVDANTKKWEKFLTSPYIKCSAVSGEGISNIKQMIYERTVGLHSPNSHNVVITNMRHVEELHAAGEALERILSSIGKVPLDCIAVDVNSALTSIGNITGTNASEAVLDEIFSRFCLGK